MPHEARPSPAVEDYLKTIRELTQPRTSASTSAIAGRLGVSAAAVTAMLKRLSVQGLVEHVPYYGARLTREGEQEAVRTIRRHRVLESFLVEVLGYTWDEVHAEAERLEHTVSDRLIDRMMQILGEPLSDPHGALIPRADRGEHFEEPQYPSLWDLEIGRPAILRRVSDEDPELLQCLARLELLPGVRLEALERNPGDGMLRMRVKGRELILGRELSGSVQVEPLPHE
jgi:DtxR family Mn-dependent transcriptional regulator